LYVHEFDFRSKIRDKMFIFIAHSSYPVFSAPILPNQRPLAKEERREKGEERWQKARRGEGKRGEGVGRIQTGKGRGEKEKEDREGEKREGTREKG
jgi:hypothetical protein